MVRMKKKREEKANFLRLEQLKRAMEEEGERKRQEQEALEKERRRLAKEKERREADKALYAETIAAARLRREGHRAGTILPSNTTNSSTSSSSASLRNSERNKLTDSRRLSSKPPFDPSLSIPRRDDSDPAYYDSSPGSSRSPSVNHSTMSPKYLSPTPSMYSTHTSSSEEVRQHRSSKRNSVIPAAAAAAEGSTSSPYHRPPIASYPTWSSSSQTLPQVRPLPDLGHDMPLLPPTAPFMKYNRGSKGSSPPSSSRRGSFNSSNELVNQLLPPQTTRSSSRHLSNTAVPPPSRTKPERRPTNERRSSGDSSALSLHSTQHQQRPSPSSSKSQSSVSRGRPSLPAQFLQTPSAWPGLPSQNGLMPMPMPMPMGYSPMNAYPVMFYSTGPMPTMQSVQMGSGGGRGGNSNGWREPLVSWYSLYGWFHSPSFLSTASPMTSCGTKAIR